ncbi:uncharacterized protein LOC113209164 [Frankliniella occidentalis]|uniref:Uncharacterized protein LOC113209164 n=1 Tax=Frankliniella occidentalis TaxID=133901 RepID=A0A6J1SSN6_FRAOC|nr:uncharacterized protein LOC113209164 [Frankliniella occidentalis]
MEELPDDVLLEVMSYLGVPDLLACRLVCKRIGELALHPHVWRRQTVDCDKSSYGRVLRFAPCLGTLIIDFPCRDKELQLYSATRCAVSSLSLHVGRNAPRDRLLHAAMIIRNQEALGRLRELTVKFHPDRKEGDAYFTLLWTAAYTSGLEALTVNILDEAGAVRPAPHLRPQPPCASVKVFQSHLRPELIPFCEFVMAAHAPTIEAVNFYYELFPFGSQTVAPTLSSPTKLASLLAGMPNLRSLLGCPLIAGLEAVAACESLREVCLLVGPKGQPAVPAAAEFLHRTKQLRAVSLKYYVEGGGDVVGDDLVLALVSSGPSSVESLEVQGYGYCYPDMPVRQMLPLSRALPLMPALKKLTVGMTSREVLLAITPETNPALRTLELYHGELKDPRCAHHCLHSDLVVTVLSKNPSLELKVRLAYFCKLCDWCKKGCHREVWGNKVRKAGEWTTIPRLVD